MTTHTPAPNQPHDAPAAVASIVPDLRDTPLTALVDQPEDGTDPVVERVLGLEAKGLLTSASFNASI